MQCCQLADSSAAKEAEKKSEKSMPEEIRGRIFPERAKRSRFLKQFSFLYFSSMNALKN
jgi:hypothetical protein